jgi:hypothetical protein
MVDYAKVLAYHPDYHGRLWTITDNDYSTLVMNDDGPKPTKKSLDDRSAEVEHQLGVALVKAERRSRYMAETDGLYFEAMRGDGDLTAWREATAQIQREFPYPEAP